MLRSRAKQTIKTINKLKKNRMNGRRLSAVETSQSLKLHITVRTNTMNFGKSLL